MGDELGGGPVEVLGGGSGEAFRGETLGTHLLGEDQDFELKVEGSGLLVVFVLEVGQRRGVACWSWGLGLAEGSEGFRRDNPRGDGGVEGLGQEGAEGLVLPGLQVAGGPVV